MANRRIEVDIIANDKASSVFQSVRAASSGMASTLMRALGGTVGAVGNLDGALRTYNASMWRFNRVVGSVVRTAGDSIYNFTKDAINNFSALEQQHAKTMGAMATEYGKTAEAQAKFLEDSQKLKQQAITLGTYGPNGKGALNSIVDVSYAQTALVKSGMLANDLLGSDAVESILKFAGGNDLDIDTATTFAVNLATVFDKPVQEWGKMLDMVTKAADISVIDVTDIMDSLTYTGGIASGLGRNLEEVLGVISVMGQAGLRGRVAGTGLQAFFTRILSAGELTDKQIEKAPTKYVGQMYNAFVAEATNADGTFKEMDDVAALLDTAMGSLNDQEQAWFAKKLFGLYQMKAAYALTGAIDGDTNMITDFIDQIQNQSAGTNDVKYELMQTSQYGKLASLGFAWEGIKTDVGDKLSPVVSAVADELLSFLKNNGNYNINWDRLREAINESGDLIGAQYGEQLGQIVSDIGNFGIDAGLVGSAMTPLVGGIAGGIGKLLQGDISGALDELSQGLDNTNGAIDDLPDELQGSARAARNVIIAFTALSGINLATQIAQIITTAFNTFIGKPIGAITAKLTSGNTTVSSANSVVNANYVQVNTGTSSVQAGTATAVNIGSVPLMNVTATIVNVYGGSGFNGRLPGGGGSPLSPSGGGSLLPWFTAGGGIAIGSGVTKALPGLIGGGSGIAGMLPGATAGAAGAATAGKIVTMYNVGGTYMTASQIAGTIASKAALGGLTALGAIGAIELFGSPGLLQSNDKRVQQGSDWLDKYVSQGNTDYTSIANNARVFDWIKNQSGYTGNNGSSIVEAEMKGRASARDEMMSYYKTGAGAGFLNELFAKQIEENGKITEDFLTQITQWTKDGYTYTGSNEDIKEILNFMYTNFGSDYKDSWNYSGKFNDSAINDFLKGNLELNTFDSISQSVQDVIDSSNDVVTSVNRAIDRIQSPNISVNVTTNVDKNGNATSRVNVSSISRDVARRSSQYGQIAMDR